jgi:hypothetical protein
VSEIRVVVAEVGCEAEIKEIDSGLEAMQAIVEGPIEVLRLNGHIFMVVNEEGRLKKLPPNRIFTVVDGRRFEPGITEHARANPTTTRAFQILGTMFVSKTGGGSFVSLTEEEAEEIRQILNTAQIVFDAAEVNA